MPAIAPPPLARPRIAPPPRRQPPAAPLPGRSLADYLRWFALEVHTLRGRDVLDVAAGLSSFTAEACARKINAVAVDPIYGESAASLAAGSLTSFVPDVAVVDSDAGAPVQRFLNDYETHFIHNRYVRASLPRLPFFDGTFDLVLCAHLFFSGARPSDFDWTLAAVVELVRVSAGEVRLYPLNEVSGKTYPGLPRLRRALKDTGIQSEMRPAAVDTMTTPAGCPLVLRKVAS